jgi:hypothetical protein
VVTNVSENSPSAGQKLRLKHNKVTRCQNPEDHNPPFTAVKTATITFSTVKHFVLLTLLSRCIFVIEHAGMPFQ